MSYKKVYRRNPAISLSGKNVYFISDTHFYHANIIKYTGRPFLPKELDEKLRAIPKNPKYDGWDRDTTRHIEIPDEAIELMNDTIVNNINAVVRGRDYLFHLGDVGFFDSEQQLNELMARINCKNVFLVMGNHDEEYLAAAKPFKQVLPQSSFINIHGQDIMISHYAMLTWDRAHRSAWSLFGHSHGSLNKWIAEHLPNSKMLDVGVDSNNFKPWSFEEIQEYMSTKTTKAIDHHGA